MQITADNPGNRCVCEDEGLGALEEGKGVPDVGFMYISVLTGMFRVLAINNEPNAYISTGITKK